MDGWIIIDKPHGLGSTQAVSAVKRALREAGESKRKIGHGGTLDPLATGVLPIAIGEATKLAGRMLDLEGAAIATSDMRPDLASIADVLPRFTGAIEQVPPAYSAIKIDGERAYDRARAGETFEIKTRSVVIHALRIKEEEDPHPALLPQAGGGGRLDEITLTAHVSKGTYIRSLARDIARALGTVGHVTMLRRTKAGPFTLASAISLDKLGEAAKARDLEAISLPLMAGLDDIPALSVDPDQARALREGRTLIGTAAHHGLHLAIDGTKPVALVEAIGPEVRVVRGFNL